MGFMLVRALVCCKSNINLSSFSEFSVIFTIYLTKKKEKLLATFVLHIHEQP